MAKSISLKSSDNIRILSAAMVEKAASGHPGGAMGGADFIHILSILAVKVQRFSQILNKCEEKVIFISFYLVFIK